MKKTKNIKYLVSILFTFFAFITLLVSLSAVDRKKYKIVFNNNDSNNKLIVTNVKIDGDKSDLKRYQNKDFKYNEKKKALVSTNNDDEKKLDIKISKISDLEIHAKVSSSKDKVKLVGEDINKEITVRKSEECIYYEYASVKNILIDYVKSLDLGKICIFAVLFFIIGLVEFLSVCVFNSFLKSIKNKTLNVKNIVLAFIALFIFYLSSIYLLLFYFSYFVIIPILLVVAYLIYDNRKVISDKTEYLYVIISLFMGISILYLLPPFHVPDEGQHFIKAYDLSYIDKSKVRSKKEGYLSLQQGTYDFMYKYSYDPLDGEYKFNSKRYFVDLFENCDYNKKGVVDSKYSATMNLPIIVYLPSAIIIMIAKFINLSPIVMFLICKLVNLCISTLLCYLAIKITPVFKKVLMAIALFPIFLQQAAAINQDWLTNSISMFFIANILLIIYDKNVNVKSRMLILLISSFILSMCKFGYFPVFLLILLIPNNKFENKKTAIICKSLMILPLILSFALNSSMGGATVTKDATDPNKYPITTIFTNPFEIIRIVIITFLKRGNADLVANLVDGFGWSTKWHYDFLRFVIVALFCLILFSSDKDYKKLKMKERIGFGIVSVIITGIIYAAMLFCWTQIGSEMIDGLQSRYFIVPLMLFYISISNNLIVINVKNKNLFYAILLIISYCIVLFTISSKYYL